MWLGQAGADDESVLPTVKARKLLGREYSALVYDGHSGFDPEALGIAAGAIAAGGLLILLTPPLATWPEFKDPEYVRILPAGYGPEAVSGRFMQERSKKKWY